MGYAFHWPKRSRHPYFLTDDGRKIFLTVTDYVPYLVTDGYGIECDRHTAMPSSSRSTKVRNPKWKKFEFVDEQATLFSSRFEDFGGPPFESVRRRVTTDMNTRETIDALDDFQHVTVDATGGTIPGGKRDVLVTVYYLSLIHI